MELETAAVIWVLHHFDLYLKPKEFDIITDNIGLKWLQNKNTKHDNKLPPVTNEFKVGNKVLLYRTKAEKQWSEKFEHKWDGPVFVHKILENGSYKLRLDGKILAKVAHKD
ncbi:hypothetical protein G9A89_004619 [Geosiphon pyriformis]|nr:hypothetical protein G9A89_004619 [Geosiphon pyriformis]